MRIAATIISGNSEALVEDAVQSVGDLVDSIILIDTGITDKTAEIVESVADEFGVEFVRQVMAWNNNFGEMRNFALFTARLDDANWALTLDTDERFKFDAKSVRRQLAEPGVDVWLGLSDDGHYAKERFIRADAFVWWQGRTHEALLGKQKQKQLVDFDFSEITKTNEQQAAKLERDLKLLSQQIEAQPNDARWYFYMGQNLEGMGRIDEAVQAYVHCANLIGWEEQCGWACFKAGELLAGQGKYAQARSICAGGLGKASGFPELAWLASHASYQLGDMKAAITWAEMSIAIGHVKGTCAGKTRVGFRHLRGWYEGPFDILRFCRPSPEAEVAYQKAVEARKAA